MIPAYIIGINFVVQSIISPDIDILQLLYIVNLLVNLHVRTVTVLMNYLTDECIDKSHHRSHNVATALYT